MNKTEYMKILRKISNNFKSECINNDDLKRSIFLIDSAGYSKKFFLNAAIIESISSIICVCNDKNYLSMALFLFIIIDIHLYYMSEAYEKSFADCYKINKESLKNYENQIERIENAIEFFRSSSEEEVQKYLSYKMGDSKKIN